MEKLSPPRRVLRPWARPIFTALLTLVLGTLFLGMLWSPAAVWLYSVPLPLAIWLDGSLLLLALFLSFSCLHLLFKLYGQTHSFARETADFIADAWGTPDNFGFLIVLIAFWWGFLLLTILSEIAENWSAIKDWIALPFTQVASNGSAN